MENFIEYLKIRKDLYLFLGKGFYLEPNIKYLEETKKRLPILKAIYEMTGVETLNNGYASMVSSFTSEGAKLDDGLINLLACEFASLFLGVQGAIGEPSVATSESVYLSPRKIAMQEQRDAVCAFYAKYNMGASLDFSEPEDHVSAEMGFLATMSQAAYDACIEDNEEEVKKLLAAQKKFIDEHLFRFIHIIAGGMKNKAKSEYYKAFGELATGYVEADKLFLAAFLEEKDGEGGLQNAR